MLLGCIAFVPFIPALSSDCLLSFDDLPLSFFSRDRVAQIEDGGLEIEKLADSFFPHVPTDTSNLLF